MVRYLYTPRRCYLLSLKGLGTDSPEIVLLYEDNRDSAFHWYNNRLYLYLCLVESIEIALQRIKAP